MKKSITLFTALILLGSSAFAADVTSYTVKSFKLIGDEVVSKMLTEFSAKNNLEVISCDVYEAELICVFKSK